MSEQNIQAINTPDSANPPSDSIQLAQSVDSNSHLNLLEIAQLSPRPNPMEKTTNLPDQKTHLNKVAQEIQTLFDQTRVRFTQEVSSQGKLLGRPLDAVKNFFGTKNGSDTINSRFDQEKLKVDRLQTLAKENNQEEFRKIYLELTGTELDPPNNQKITRRLLIEPLVGDYQKSQRDMVNTVALAIPFALTGFRGAPIVMRSESLALRGLTAIGNNVPASMLHDAAIVAGGNTLLKAVDGRFSDPYYDAATGFVTGALWAPAQRASTRMTEGWMQKYGTTYGVTPLNPGKLTTTFDVNNKGFGMYMSESYLRHGSSWSLYGAYEPIAREATDFAFGKVDSYSPSRVAANSFYGFTSGLFFGQSYGMTYTPALNKIFNPIYSQFK
ncbi:hypothetical protein KA183_05460 [bacterium]|nr:hypothetical protein [bacterium]QQR56642.1 MAG: hypothetical protein IPG59_16790 [Candidatus Melainabacteria bacterium]